MHETNRARLLKRATVDKSLQVGDTVLVKAEERLTNTARWDAGCIVTRAEGTTHWVRNVQNGRERRVHREKLKLVDPDEEWNRITPRPRRKHDKPALKKEQTEEVRLKKVKPQALVYKSVSDASLKYCRGVHLLHRQPKRRKPILLGFQHV